MMVTATSFHCSAITNLLSICSSMYSEFLLHNSSWLQCLDRTIMAALRLLKVPYGQQHIYHRASIESNPTAYIFHCPAQLYRRANARQLYIAWAVNNFKTKQCERPSHKELYAVSSLPVSVRKAEWHKVKWCIAFNYN